MSDTQRALEPQPGLREQIERGYAQQAEQRKEVAERLAPKAEPEEAKEAAKALMAADPWGDIISGNVDRRTLQMIVAERTAFTREYFSRFVAQEARQ